MNARKNDADEIEAFIDGLAADVGLMMTEDTGRNGCFIHRILKT